LKFFTSYEAEIKVNMFQNATGDEVSIHYFNSETGQSMEWCHSRIRLTQPP
jgi:hypothetical protein